MSTRYPFDPSGLTSEGISSASWTVCEYSPTTLADEPRWQRMHHGNRCRRCSARTAPTTLGFQPAKEANDGRFGRITVKVRRPDAEVRARAGATAPQTQHGERVERPAAPITGLDKAFGAALPSGTLPLEVTVAAFALGDGKQALVVVTTAARRPVSEQIAVEKLDVRTAAFDYGETKERAAHRQTAEVTLRPNEQTSGDSRCSRVDGQARPIRDSRGCGGGELGGVFTQVEVPDFAKSRLTMSGLILGRTRIGESDIVADLMIPIVPTAARVFTPTAPITAFVRLYQGGKDAPGAVQVRTRIVDGRHRLSSRTSPRSTRLAFKRGGPATIGSSCRSPDCAKASTC